MNSDPEPYNPFQLAGVVLLVLLGFIAFFISFVTVPLLLLGVFYLWSTLRDRAYEDRQANNAGGS